ncbi:hypothetical protein [Paracoccus mutanolyticus]|uniref:hypothetical protein n=1 Tax=Paracoccus mutanolyticus TaxID=1499308 RepID=UPI0011AE2F8D|nr:hypothetical protein [Paracoccus mutanolyticus]
MCFSTTPGADPALSTALPRFPAPIRPHWQATAAAKGFRILARSGTVITCCCAAGPAGATSPRSSSC